MDAMPFEIPIDYEKGQNGVGKPIYAGGEQNVRAQFVKSYEPDPTALAQGREGWIEQVICLIQVKGDTNTPAARVRDHHKSRFPLAWKHFEKGQAGALGTSISDLYRVGPKQVFQCKQLGIFTIEQLAKSSEVELSQIDDGDILMADAAVWLSSRKNDQDAASLIVEASTMRSRNEELAAENARLMKELEAAKKSRTKRKAKAKAKPNETSS